MSGDYLWDKSPPGDPEVEALEETLGVLGHRGEVPSVPTPVRVAPRRSTGFAMAAAVAALIVGAVVVARVSVGTPQFLVTQTSGEPGLCSNPEDPASGSPVVSESRWDPGHWLVTDARSTAQVQLADIGEMTVSESSKIRLVTADPNRHRFSLRQGRIDARVAAPPRLFVVDTPAATAVDLGCEYSLEVDEQGGGRLHVSSGWVEMVGDNQTTFVPADAFCQTYPEIGPGLPWVVGASPELIQAILEFDLAPSGDSARAVIARTAPQDTLTLWHLLQRVEGPARTETFNQLDALVAAPVRAPRDLNERALEMWLVDVLDEYWVLPEEMRKTKRLQ